MNFFISQIGVRSHVFYYLVRARFLFLTNDQCLLKEAYGCKMLKESGFLHNGLNVADEEIKDRKFVNWISTQDRTDGHTYCLIGNFDV